MDFKVTLYTGQVTRGGCGHVYYDEDKEPYEELEKKQDNTEEA
jgi:hypothetical protein